MSRVKNNTRPVVYADGLQSRDFVSVHDIVQANILAMEKDAANYQVYNVGSGRSLTIRDIADTIIRLSGKKLRLEITEKFRQGDIRHCFSSIDKIKKELGYRPRVGFKKGMEELFKWSKKEESIDYFDKANQELKAKGIL